MSASQVCVVGVCDVCCTAVVIKNKSSGASLYFLQGVNVKLGLWHETKFNLRYYKIVIILSQ